MYPFPVVPIEVPDVVQDDRSKVEEILGPNTYSQEQVLGFVFTHVRELSDALRNCLDQFEIGIDPNQRLTIPELIDALERSAISNANRINGFAAVMGYTRDCKFVYSEFQRVMALYAGNSHVRCLAPLAELGDLLWEMSLAFEEGPILKADDQKQDSKQEPANSIMSVADLLRQRVPKAVLGGGVALDEWLQDDEGEWARLFVFKAFPKAENGHTDLILAAKEGFKAGTELATHVLKRGKLDKTYGQICNTLLATAQQNVESYRADS